ncbi:hypothetical protein WG902_16815 [Ramlibacter sp. PS3R-8]|uniref:hypothetical protein n=1 Tax=Ramlibacter sp. PS3R-8 TaxID=3133437 RepID=UPI0030A36B71
MQNQLQALTSQFFEANLALNLFVASSSTPSFASRDAWERDAQRRSEIRNAVESELGGWGVADWEAVHLESELRFKREKWSNGSVPREFEHKVPFLYARAFLYALDAFDKILGALSREPQVPSQVSDWHAQVEVQFPHLRGVRNTSQHVEDRGRGLGAGRNPQPLDLKPIDNNFIKAPGGALVLNSLNGSRYGSTMADGHYGEIDVSPQSMEQVQRILVGVLGSFRWQGPKQHLPHA